MIRVDYNTTDLQRGRFARLAVIVDLYEPFVSMFSIDGEDFKVEYETLDAMYSLWTIWAFGDSTQGDFFDYTTRRADQSSMVSASSSLDPSCHSVMKSISQVHARDSVASTNAEAPLVTTPIAIENAPTLLEEPPDGVLQDDIHMHMDSDTGNVDGEIYVNDVDDPRYFDEFVRMPQM